MGYVIKTITEKIDSISVTNIIHFGDFEDFLKYEKDLNREYKETEMKIQYTNEGEINATK